MKTVRHAIPRARTTSGDAVAAASPGPAVLPGPASESRIPALDGLRGIAVLLVLMIHFEQTIPRPDHVVNGAIAAVFRTGWIGVDLFFVLSGFLITGILLEAKGQPNYFRNFYMRRVLRIFPLYYVSLAIMVVLLPALFPAHPFMQEMKSEAVWYWTYLANFRLGATGWLEGGYIGHFWSLAVEEQFYMVWPLLVLLLSRRGMFVACAGIILAAIAVRVVLYSQQYVIAAYVLTPARFDALAIGGLIALLARRPGGLRRHATLWAILAISSTAAVVGFFLAYGGLSPHAPLVTTVGYTIIACMFGSLMVLAMLAPAGSVYARVTHSGTLSFFGRYSYALYVVHPVVIYFWPSALSGERLRGPADLWLVGYLLSSALMLTVCTALALLSWHLLEKRFLRFRHLFAGPAISQHLVETSAPRITRPVAS
jgi:peptidoglycan/LPS O-acetylase OafA/YrhL